MENRKIKLKIGPYEICPIPTGFFGLDGGAMFGTVPKVLWEKSNPPDDKNRIKMEARALLLKSSDRNILIDTGNGSDFVLKYGEKLGSKFNELYNISDDPNNVSLEKSLSKFNLKPTDITDVILTHLHFDHAGGATKNIENKVQPSFPNATYYIQEKNLQTAMQPNLREKASYLPANYQSLIDKKCLKIISNKSISDDPLANFSSEILPGISVLISNGHTQGQQIVKISDDKITLLYCGDVIPTSSHVKIPWLMGYDLHPLLLMEEKKIILSKAAQENWYLFFEHDPYCDAAQVSVNGTDYQLQEKYWL